MISFLSKCQQTLLLLKAVITFQIHDLGKLVYEMSIDFLLIGNASHSAHQTI
jgi:hypothetical protein